MREGGRGGGVVVCCACGLCMTGGRWMGDSCTFVGQVKGER